MSDAVVFLTCLGAFFALSAMAIIVFRFGEGLWGNFILLQNMTIGWALLIALMPSVVAFSKMIAEDMVGGEPGYYAVPLGWVTFAVILTILQLITNKLSEVKVKFNPFFDLFINLLVMGSIWSMYLATWWTILVAVAGLVEAFNQ